MREYSEKELMIPERNKAARLEPKIGELVQGIGFSLLTAIDHLDSAEQLFKVGKKGAGYSLFINGLEELGKINKLFNVLLGRDKNKKAKEYQVTQKAHIEKLKAAFKIFSSLLNLKSTEIEINKLFAYDGSENPIDFVLKKISPDAADKYHLLRQKAIYTDYDGSQFSSPYHHLGNIDNESYEALSMILRESFNTIYSVGSKFFPVIFEIIHECYYCEDQQRIKFLKKEINRRVLRFMPSIRKIANEVYLSEYGVSLDDLADIPKEKRPIKISINAKELLGNLSSLIKGHEEIEKIYFYPPLKEWAKEHYSQFTSPNLG